MPTTYTVPAGWEEVTLAKGPQGYTVPADWKEVEPSQPEPAQAAPLELQAARSVIDRYRSQLPGLGYASFVSGARDVLQRHGQQQANPEDATRLAWAEQQLEKWTQPIKVQETPEQVAARGRLEKRMGLAPGELATIPGTKREELSRQAEEPHDLAEALMGLQSQEGTPPFLQKTAGDWLGERMPFLGGAKKASDLGTVITSLKRLKATEGSPEKVDPADYWRVAHYLKTASDEEKRGFFSKVGNMVSEMPAFITEIALTGGLGAAGRKAVTTGLEKYVSKKVAGKVATGAAGIAAQSAIQASLSPQMVAENAMRRYMPEFGVTADEQGKLRAVFDPAKSKTFLGALAKGGIDTTLMFGSMHVAQPILGTVAKAAFLKKWLQGVGSAGKLGEVLKKGGWNGAVQMLVANRLNELARAGIQGDELPNYLSKQFAEQFAVEAISLAIPEAVMRTVSGIEARGGQPSRSEATGLGASPEEARSTASRRAWFEAQGPELKAYYKTYGEAIKAKYQGEVEPPTAQGGPAVSPEFMATARVAEQGKEQSNAQRVEETGQVDAGGGPWVETQVPEGPEPRGGPGIRPGGPEGRQVPREEQTQAEAEVTPPPPVRGGPSGPIPVSPLPIGQTISTGEVVKQLSDQFGVPIRIGHFRARKATAGIYKTLEDVARLKGYGDIAAASHEVAHRLDTVEGALQNWRAVPAAARAELRALDYQPNRRDMHEGFAEYMRHRLTMDDAATVAPEFDAWFNGTWLAGKQETAGRINAAKATIDEWRNAGSLGRVEAQIDMGEGRLAKVGNVIRKPIETARTVGEWITDNWISRTAPLLRASKQMAGVKTATQVMQKMRGDYNFWAFARVTNMAASAKARAWADSGVADVAGNKLGPGLRETVAPIAHELRDPKTLRQFYAYAYARHAIELYENARATGEPLKNPGILEQDARNVVTQLDPRPGWQAASDGLTAWHNGLIDYLVEAGGLDAQAAATMKAMYPHYISLARKMDSEFASGPGAGGSRYANLPSAVKRLKGSGREIQPPLESALAYAERIIGIADKVRVGRMLVEASEHYGTLGDMVEKVDPKMVPHSTRLQSLKSQLEQVGADLQEADMDALLTVFSQDITGIPKDNVLVLWRDGKRQTYWVRDDLYRAMTAFNKPYRLPAILDQTIGRIARLTRLGYTGIRAGFSLLTNPLRDLQTAFLQTEYQGKNPFSLATNAVRGLVGEITGSDIAQLWERGGGPMAQPLGIDRVFLKEATHELLAQTPKSKALNWMEHPVDSLRSLFSTPESAPRLAEFKVALEKLGWKPGQKVTFEQYVKAQLAAANVTVDFRDGGSLAMWINQIVPFFNANIQGPHRMAAALHSRPATTIMRGALAMTLPSLALWWKQKDEDWHKQLTPMERYRYWHVRVPGTKTILRIPKPFEWGHLFGSLPEAVAEATFNQNPQAIGEAMAVAVETTLPDVVPAAARPLAEIAANRDFFFNRPLVPQHMEHLRPEDQVTPYTSETAKAIGNLFGISPIYVEHLASGWTGGLADEVTKALEYAGGGATHKTQRQIVGGPSTIPVLGRLFLSPTHTRILDDFYTKLEEAEQDYGSAKLQNKWKSVPPELRRMRRTAERLSELWGRSRKILDDVSLSDNEKRERFLDLHTRMIELAKKRTPGKPLKVPRAAGEK